MPAVSDLIVERMAAAGAISLGKTNTPESGRVAHGQPGLRGHPQPLRPEPHRRRQQRRRGRRAGRPADLPGRWQRPRRVAAQPGSFCNVVGFRPSPGRVPKWPFSDVAGVLGVSGPMARTVADVALLLAVQSGPDPRAPFALDAPPPLTDPQQVIGLLAGEMPGLRGLRVAWSADLGLPVQRDVLDVLAPARQVLTDLGAQVVDAAPDLTGADDVFRTWRAFRFATRFGPLLREHPDQLGPNVTWNTERGLELTVACTSAASPGSRPRWPSASPGSSATSTCSRARSARSRRSMSSWTGCMTLTACRSIPT